MTRKIRRRTFLAGSAAATVTGSFVPVREAAAQFLTGHPIVGSPNFVMVEQGVSQAAIQVVSPSDQSLVATQLLGGAGYEIVLNGVKYDLYGGMNASTKADVVNRQGFDVLTNQWHTVFGVTPANCGATSGAIGEIVTVITVGQAGDPYTPTSLTAAKALAPQLWSDFVPQQRPFTSASSWNQPVNTLTATYTSIAWPADTGFNYGVSWEQFSAGIYYGLSTDPLVTVTYPASWGFPGPSVNVRIPAAHVNASFSAKTMTVNSIAANETVQIGMIVLSGTGITPGLRIVAPQISGTPGGVGVYTTDTTLSHASVDVVLGVSGAVGTDGEIIILNGTTVHNFWVFVRTGLNTGTAQAYANCDALLDDGWGTASPFKGAGVVVAGSSELAGLLRKAVHDGFGDIPYALQLQVDSAHNLTGHVFPAIADDGAATTNPPGIVQTGQRLAIPPTTAMPGGLSTFGQIVWRCLQKYGCYVIDSTGGVYAFRANPLEYDDATITAFKADCPAIIRALQTVGGTP